MNKLEIERAKKIWQGLNSQEINLVLWACTNYPVDQSDEVLAALSDVYKKSGGDLLTALEQADQQRQGQIG